MADEERRGWHSDDTDLSEAARTKGTVLAAWTARGLWLWFGVAAWRGLHGERVQSGTMLVVLPFVIWSLLTAWSGRDYRRGSPWHRPANSLMILLLMSAFATFPFGISSEFFAVTATRIVWARLAFYLMFVGCTVVALYRTRAGVMPMTMLTSLSAGFFFAYGAVSIVNGWAETAPATVVSAEVLSKDVEIDPDLPSGGHIFAYKLGLKVLDEVVRGTGDPNAVEVSSKDFDRVEPGMVITLSRHQGLLGCFWFLLEGAAPLRGQ